MHRTWRGRGAVSMAKSAFLCALVASSCAVGGAAERPSYPPVETTVLGEGAAQPQGTEDDDPRATPGIRSVEGAEAVLAGAASSDPDKDPLEPARVAPSWLGRVELLPRAQSAGPRPTPIELTNRQFPTPSGLAAPASTGFTGQRFEVSREIAARSSWSPDCPVELDELAYLQVTHWGFDGRRHTGELLVNAEAADDMIIVFRKLYDVGYPIEEMRVKSPADMTAVATGDNNVTSSFECRRSTASRRWSEHAFGTAIDINPFHNPYLKGNYVIPHLAYFYTDRSLDLPGMIDGNDVAVEAFAEMGWKWGGEWTSLKDWMHFSAGGT